MAGRYLVKTASIGISFTASKTLNFAVSCGIIFMVILLSVSFFSPGPGAYSPGLLLFLVKSKIYIKV